MSVVMQRPASESAVAALSLAFVGLIVCTAVMLGMSAEPRSSPLPLRPGAQATAQSALAQKDAGASLPNDPRMAQITERFEQAVVMLHAHRYEEAVVALERVIKLSPRLPEAYVNLGYAMLGLERYENARDFFLAATELQPYQGNAYWGLAVALEALDDIDGALGAMRTYIHLTPQDEPRLRRARSALWEWETRRERGPLPENEARWIEERTREWEERNLPDRDAREQQRDLAIPIGRK
ncbi:MAG: tetratricopeptide repeat protein [Chromatiales bacterium]|jgi:tetratricopeptide (TPR) repeat protein|nr:tetratricopeptide repeat protein [Chromatiales bacterium]